MKEIKAFFKLLWIVLIKAILSIPKVFVFIIRFVSVILGILQSTTNHLIENIEKEALLK